MPALNEVIGSHIKNKRAEKKVSLAALVLKMRPESKPTVSKLSRLEAGKQNWSVYDLLCVLEALEMENAILSVEALEPKNDSNQ